MIYPSPANDYRTATVVVAPGSKWHVGAHWHEAYDEVMRIAKGRAKIRLGNTFRVIGPEDGEIFIPKFVVHDIMRADVDAKVGEGDDEELWIEERGEPVDGSKEVFFRNVFSVMADREKFGWKMPLQLLLTLIYTDGYLVILPGPARFWFTYGLYAMMRPLLFWLGLKPFYDEYTPERLRGIASELAARKSKEQ
ncbi:hypothetical protein EJ04DRAFT_449038 [Polyplosphaeria fusca]|uniref:Uncharacterized protein n=1 Tax=Polyplosphaeria fusca TaxID=682080 RepID=A0A9P4QPL4_9PLEO|nr:hypothetical protein EJ04DRAFT_449038 [Polyplosphaeria fusca]